MLKSLTIQNYALIDHLRLIPGSHFTTVTGETGAGKSIMLGALGLLLGERADSRSLLKENEKCIIEGAFQIEKLNLAGQFDEWDVDYAHETIIRREILPSGKSRSFINDTPATLSVLKQLGKHIIDIHSQHDHLLVTDSGFQLNLLDIFSGNEANLEAYFIAYKKFKNTKKKLEELENLAADGQKDLDYDMFILKELNDAELDDPGELELLEQELELLEHAEIIKQRLNEGFQLLSESEFNAVDSLQSTLNELSKIADLSADLTEIHSRLEAAWIEIKDIASEINSINDQTILDEIRLEEIKDRLSNFYRLLSKHQVSQLNELIDLRENLINKIDSYESIDDQIQHHKKRVTEAEIELIKAGKLLTNERNKHKETLCRELEALLNPLGIPHAKFKMELYPISPTPSGMEDAELLFSANKGHTPIQLRKAASGGEISRVMFAIKYILTGKKLLPSIIFDEIDIGISGEISIKMAEMMRKMAKNIQVIAITHLPQIAAMGEKHYFVYKNSESQKTISNIREIRGDERIQTLAEMIGGKSPSKASVDSAKELLARSSKD